jgi:hypothetical protein
MTYVCIKSVKLRMIVVRRLPFVVHVQSVDPIDNCARQEPDFREPNSVAIVEELVPVPREECNCNNRLQLMRSVSCCCSDHYQIKQRDH